MNEEQYDVNYYLEDLFQQCPPRFSKENKDDEVTIDMCEEILKYDIIDGISCIDHLEKFE